MNSEISLAESERALCSVKESIDSIVDACSLDILKKEEVLTRIDGCVDYHKVLLLDNHVPVLQTYSVGAALRIRKRKQES